MAPWLIALIFVVALCGFGWLVDFRARRRRRGLTSFRGARTREDNVAEVERLAGGTAIRAETHDLPNLGSQ